MNIVIKNEGEFSNIIIYLYKENKKKTKIKVGTISQKELDIDINIYRYISFIRITYSLHHSHIINNTRTI